MSTASGFLFHSDVQKWFNIDRWWVGFSGSYRLAELLKHRAPKLDGSAFDVCGALRRMVAADGWLPLRSDGEGPVRHDLNCILVSPDLRVSEFGTMGITVENGDEFTAMGSAYEFALGAAHALRDASPEIRVRSAIAAAMRFDGSCGGSVFVKEIKREAAERTVPRFVSLDGPIGTDANGNGADLPTSRYADPTDAHLDLDAQRARARREGV